MQEKVFFVPDIQKAVPSFSFSLLIIYHTSDCESVCQFFVRYTRDIALSGSEERSEIDAAWDEDSSVWTLVQWGIPEGPKSATNRMDMKEALKSGFYGLVFAPPKKVHLLQWRCHHPTLQSYLRPVDMRNSENHSSPAKSQSNRNLDISRFFREGWVVQHGDGFNNSLNNFLLF